MTKISSKTAYPKKKPISSDYFVGTDSEDFNKTVNFGFEEVAGLVNKLNGTPLLNYLFSTSPYLSTEVLLEGRFLSDENELSTPSLTKLYINKFNNSGDNLQELYLFLQTNATDFYLKLRNSNNQNNAVYFDIASIEDFPDYFILNITVFKENEFLPLLENLNVYFFDFELKATAVGTSDPLKLDKDGYTGTAKDIDDRIIVLENLQDLNTNFTGQAFAVWTGEGYVYDVIYPDYYIQGVLYPGATQQITLEASDAVYSRFDVIYVNASGAQKATGDPALNPLMPTIDEGIDLFVTSELVVALSTAPVDSSIEQVYNENIEWTTSSLGSLVNFNATNRPSKGIKNADIVNAPTAMFTQFTTPTTKNISDFNTLKFDLFFVENYGKTHGINVYFLNGSTIIGSYVIKSGLNNYKFGNFGAYQSIVVDFSSFTFTGVSFDTIKIVFPWANAGFSIDNVVLVKGSSVISPTQKAITTIVTDSGVANATISDDTFTLKGGNGASVSAVGKVITITPASEVVNTITNGDTTHSPSGDVVFDALALKANLLDAIPLTGTTPSNPVSGVIEVIEGVDFVVNGDGGNNINRIRFSEGDVRLSSEILGTGDTALIVGAAKINIISSFSGSAGLGSNKNFSPNITDLDYPQKIYVDTGLSSKLDASAYNEHFKGKYTSSGALTTANPTATDGDYAIVDAGTGVDAKEWIWDNEAGWIVGGATGASTTDALPEGSTNLYWTVARFLANLTYSNIIAALGFTPENVANKSDSYTTSSSTTYASTKALVDGLATKQNTLTNPITGIGTTNTIPKFTASGTVGNSQIFDNGTNVGIGVTSPQAKIDVAGNIRMSTSGDKGIYFDRTDGNLTYGSYIKTTGSFAQGISIDFDSGNESAFGSFEITKHSGSNSLLKIVDIGNVLINTTTDDGINKLQVNGSTKTTALTLSTAPTTSAGTYDILTRNTSTGVVEYKPNNYYQTALTNPITGTGTTNYIPKFTASGTVGNSLISDNGTDVGIGSISTGSKLNIDGNIAAGNGDRTGKSVFPLYLSASNSLGWKVADGTGLSKFEMYAGFSGINELRLLNSMKIIGSGQNLTLGTTNSTASITVANTTLGSVLLKTTTDDGINTLQVNGTVSLSPATLPNQAVTKAQLDLKLDNSSEDIVSTLGYTPEDTSYKQDSLAIDGTGTKYPTVDAINSEKQIKKIVYEGDSLTDTSGSGYPTNYPNQISDYNFDFSRANQVNVAQAGDQIQSFIAGGQYASQIQSHKPVNGKENVVFCLMMGTNDLAVGRTPTQVYDDLKTVWAQAKADRFTVVAFTVTRSTNPTRDAGAVAVAELIASDPTLYDYLIRTDLILPDPSDTFYFNGDGIHLTEEGSIKIAQELNRVVTSQINGYDYLGTSLPVINGSVSIGKSKATKFAKLDVKGFAAPAMPSASGVAQSTGVISRFSDSGNLVLDLGGAGAEGAWLQSSDASNLSINYPLLLNPNGGDVKIKRAVVESNNKDALIVSDNRTQSVGVGGSILFKGVYTDGGLPLEFARVSLMKENSTNADYSFGLGFYTSANGGANPSANPNFYISGSGEATFTSSITAADYNGDATLTGTPTAPTATAGTNTTQIATMEALQTATGNYKKYVALLTQSGTSAPTATVLENTLGGTVVWTRVNPGIYSGTLTGAFTTDKTILLNNNPVGGVFTNIFSSVNTITIQTRNYSNAQTDDGLSNTSIEIRVYN